jgi:hypothetical protein
MLLSTKRVTYFFFAVFFAGFFAAFFVAAMSIHPLSLRTPCNGKCGRETLTVFR